MDDLKQRITKLENVLKEKDNLIEQLLIDRDQEVMDLRKSMGKNSLPKTKCESCDRMRQRWKKISRNFQEVPKLLETMIQRTDKLFDDQENQ